MKVEEINATMLGLAEKMRRDGYSENSINTTKWVVGHSEERCTVARVTAPRSSTAVRTARAIPSGPAGSSPAEPGSSIRANTRPGSLAVLANSTSPRCGCRSGRQWPRLRMRRLRTAPSPSVGRRERRLRAEFTLTSRATVWCRASTRCSNLQSWPGRSSDHDRQPEHALCRGLDRSC